MKLLARGFEKDGKGFVKLLPQEDEDMWHVYNLMAVGDYVTTGSTRKIQKETSTGSTSAKKLKITLKLKITKIDFDVQSCFLRIQGQNVTESEHVKMWAFHTHDLKVGQSFTLEKDNWDALYLDRLQTATDPAQTAEVGAVVMQHGLAHLCLVTSHMTIVRQKIELSIPKKRLGSTTTHDKAVVRFYDQCLEAIIRHINFKIIKVLIISSPAFIKNDFYDYVMDQAHKKDLKMITENKTKFVLVHSASGHKHALSEALTDPSIAKKVENVKAFGEVRILERFYEMLNTESERAFYGLNHILKANEQKAIEVLLLCDDLFRSASDIKSRKTYVDLVESVRENGGDVKIFSSLHVSGEQLAKLTGVAAILRFPIAELDVEDMGGASDSDESESEEKGGKKRSGSRSNTPTPTKNKNREKSPTKKSQQRKKIGSPIEEEEPSPNREKTDVEYAGLTATGEDGEKDTIDEETLEGGWKGGENKKEKKKTHSQQVQVKMDLNMMFHLLQQQRRQNRQKNRLVLVLKNRINRVRIQTMILKQIIQRMILNMIYHLLLLQQNRIKINLRKKENKELRKNLVQLLSKRLKSIPRQRGNQKVRMRM